MNHLSSGGTQLRAINRIFVDIESDARWYRNMIMLIYTGNEPKLQLARSQLIFRMRPLYIYSLSGHCNKMWKSSINIQQQQQQQLTKEWNQPNSAVKRMYHGWINLWMWFAFAYQKSQFKSVTRAVEEHVRLQQQVLVHTIELRMHGLNCTFHQTNAKKIYSTLTSGMAEPIQHVIDNFFFRKQVHD